MAVSAGTTSVSLDKPVVHPPRRMPGDHGSPLTQSRGVARVLRIVSTALIALWFALPFLPLVLWSFANQWMHPAAFPMEAGTDGLTAAIANGGGLAFLHSLLLSLVVAVIATPLGAMAARALSRGHVRFGKAITVLLFSPVLLPPFAAVLGLNVLLLRAWVPPAVGVVLVLVAVAIPYTTFSMRAAYAAYDDGFDDAARTLGASSRLTLWRIHLPLIAPALARSAFLAFLVGWSDYLITLVVGGGHMITLPLIIASSASGVGNESSVAVLSLSAVIPPLILLGFIARTRNLDPGKQR
ncbi:ABC transporter permease subunit [Salinibacterium sp. NG253]|uniref:ABC transporter permease n=1 Tax=Salinibacterium sp. NG253 TaxID=2792039 RepID=UPI0018CFC829|nr:ABC transporter permease subunit [Salinibacterium sp. NG253]MBH0116803.1 ABC transporter permease subunit [Salinibacterium sp. NG253]